MYYIPVKYVIFNLMCVLLRFFSIFNFLLSLLMIVNEYNCSRLAEVYNPEDLESLMTTMPKCAVCGEDAPKRCSRCKNEWYCRRYSVPHVI